MRILVINGPNINMLGVRERDIYGEKDYKSLCKYIKAEGKKEGAKIKIFQSNGEKEIITAIQKAYKKYDGIIINAGAYTHTSIAILDALKAVNIRTVEVHLTDINNREEYRKKSYISEYAEKVIVGKGFIGYLEAVKELTQKK